VPFADAEVRVEVVRERVPGDVEARAALPALDVSLRRAGDVREGGVAGVQVRWLRVLGGHHRAAAAAPLRPAADARLEEVAIDDQLAAALEEVEEADRAVRALEAVVRLDGHPRHAAALGGQRVAGARVRLLLDEHLLPLGLPLLRGDDRRQVHRVVRRPGN
jgi:hypothetical protein